MSQAKGSYTSGSRQKLGVLPTSKRSSKSKVLRSICNRNGVQLISRHLCTCMHTWLCMYRPGKKGQTQSLQNCPIAARLCRDEFRILRRVLLFHFMYYVLSWLIRGRRIIQSQSTDSPEDAKLPSPRAEYNGRFPKKHKSMNEMRRMKNWGREGWGIDLLIKYGRGRLQSPPCPQEIRFRFTSA